MLSTEKSPRSRKSGTNVALPIQARLTSQRSGGKDHAESPQVCGVNLQGCNGSDGSMRAYGIVTRLRTSTSRQAHGMRSNEPTGDPAESDRDGSTVGQSGGKLTWPLNFGTRGLLILM